MVTHTKVTRGKTRPADLAAVERRRLIFELRKGGATYRQIAQTLIDQYGPDALPKGYDERQVHRDVIRELGRLRLATGLDAADVVQLELERLNALLLAVWGRATAGDYGAIDRALAIMKRMSDIQGVTVPITVDWRLEVGDLLRRGTVTPQSVIDELGEELADEIFERAGIKLPPRLLPWKDEDLSE